MRNKLEQALDKMIQSKHAKIIEFTKKHNTTINYNGKEYKNGKVYDSRNRKQTL